LFVTKNNRVFSRYINICFAKRETLAYIILFNNIDILKLDKEFLLIKRAFKAFDLQEIFLEKNKSINARLLNKNKDVLAFDNTKNNIYSKRDNKIKKLLIYTNIKNIIFEKITSRRVNKSLLILINYNSKNLILYNKIINKSNDYAFAK